MGYSRVVRGMSPASPAAPTSRTLDPTSKGSPAVNPIFTRVRLTQRILVRIHIDHVPNGVRLVAGMIATVQIDPRPQQQAK